MAVCGSRTSHIGHFVGNMAARRLHYGLSVNSSTVSYSNRSIENVRKANICLRNKGQPHNFMLSQYFRTSVAKRRGDEGFGLEGLRILSLARFSSGTTKEQAANTADSSEGKIQLKLNSGSFYLPHPAKAKTGGEDAHFVCSTTQAIGVADGVGGWADLGDSGFMLVRHGSAVFKSPVQLHGFNFPYQLEGSSAGDSPSLAEAFKITVAPGDVLVAGTDGLFDNLYDADITGVVIRAMEDGLGPQMTAQKIAALAQQRGMDQTKPSPFSDAAKEAGFEHHGGKLDDITVVVSYVTNNANL
ncbi:hypothetical protein K7X08_015132 [Anisodus acutangulus]|uniref:Protein phosphatase n=1 Tax=Anisodus acutangulus TaxID=402998 RepID=A0A9Q1L502_9SOLA|nr:hypothetical protein K7X08_015132 [Anisodus acutangulus]